MTFLSVKVFNNDNKEICSTVSVLEDDLIYDLVPYIGELARKLVHEQISDSPLNQAQALIVNNQIIGYLNSPDDLLLVAVASINTSFQKLNHFLLLLSQRITLKSLNFDSKETLENFQKICDELINSVNTTVVLNIALLGLEKSGKTTFTRFFEEYQPLGFNPYEPTDLLNIVKIEKIGDFPYQFRFFDLGMAFKQNWFRFSKESHGFIFFVDCSDPQQMNKSKELLQELRNFWDKPFVVAANKCDATKILNIRKYISRKLKVRIRQIYETETSTGFGLLPLLNGLINHEMKEHKVALSLIRSGKTSK
ncbi:MAG: ADP-ribosylation factor-like protein [Candidatus Hodarchaeota archaeon]